MDKWLKLCVVIAIACTTVCNAQHIRNSSSPKEIKRFLKDKKADRIVFCETHEDMYQIRDKKSQKWGMFDWYNQLIPVEYDTIIPFEQFQPFTLAKKDGQTVIMYWPYDKRENSISADTGFDAMEIITLGEGTVDFQYFLLASQNGHWGCINWEDLSVLIPFEYTNPEMVPLSGIIRN